jgi:hypothetical protein
LRTQPLLDAKPGALPARAPEASRQRFRPAVTASRWRAIALAVYVGLNAGLVLHDLPSWPFADDWALWTGLSAGLERGQLYDLDARMPTLGHR